MGNTTHKETLQEVLTQIVGEDAGLAPAALVIERIASAAVELAELISLGRLAGEGHAAIGGFNKGGDVQAHLDVVAKESLIDAMKRAPVAIVVTEELKDPLLLDAEAPLVVAIDPLEGSCNAETNVSIGTIFSVLPRLAAATDMKAHFLQPGRNQVAAGFVIYGPQTSLVLAMAGQTRVFILERRTGRFLLAVEALLIPRDSSEYAINASNYRHWTPSVQAFVDDCISGTEGPFGRNHNMRWVASLVAEAYRILIVGGVFLFPGDQRRGHNSGRLRLIYEANPIALAIELAGGVASDSQHNILDLTPTDLHVRTPLVFGSANPVNLITRYHTDPQFSAARAPLFGRRGLIRY
ncbi:MAG: class 1 fructose-bisphosphatase [Beijerinckiaceae bacterium]